MAVPGSWTLDALVEAYQQHQRRTRSLRDQTVLNYARFVRLLIRAALGDDPIDVGRLSPADVIQFVQDPAPGPLRFRARDRLLTFLEAL